MPIINTSQGVGGILNSFRSLVEGAGRITFVGTPGFCTPFAELLGFVVRDRELAFISSQDFEKARSIFMDYEGMQLGKLTDPHADVVVLLGGMKIKNERALNPGDLDVVILGDCFFFGFCLLFEL